MQNFILSKRNVGKYFIFDFTTAFCIYNNLSENKFSFEKKFNWHQNYFFLHFVFLIIDSLGNIFADADPDSYQGKGKQYSKPGFANTRVFIVTVN